jgi:hypothetical protein
MIRYCSIYKKHTGEIVQCSYFDCPDDIEQVARSFYGRLIFFGSEDHDFIESESDPSIHYVVISQGEASIFPRPNLQVSANKTTLISNGVDSVTLGGLPNPCEVVQDPGEPEEERITVTGGGFVFTAENPGKYQFRIERFPFLPLDLEFTAT